MVVTNSRKGIGLAAGALLAGVALGAVGVMSLRGGDGPYASSPPGTRSMGAPGASSAFIAAVAGNCELAPVLPTAGEGDGQVVLQAKPAAASADEVASLILSGKEAAAAGRQRDAEVSFLNACRNAALLRDGDGMPLADAMYQLGRHYATVVAFGAGRSGDLLQRAERLYSASLEAYRARLGPGHEKTNFAREGLITVQQVTAGKGAPVAKAAPTPPAPVPAPAAAAAAAAPAPAEVAKAPDPPKAPEPAEAKPPAPAVAVKPRPERRRTAPPTTAEAPEAVRLPEPPPPRTVRLPAPEPVDEAPPEPPPAASMGAGGGGEASTAEGSASPE